ncbi:MAG: SAM-dependent methyltransferase, partial [Rubripirellula sp.]
AESAVKESALNDGWRLAFSRPGFVTLKHEELREPPQGIFIRTASRSIGSARNGSLRLLTQTLVEKLNQQFDTSRPFNQLHVWSKDRAPIGRFGFEPGPDEVSEAVSQEIFPLISQDWLTCDQPNRIAESGDRVLDLVLVEPAHWFLGWHQASDWHTRWPGGVQPIKPTNETISRAYFKAAESITWSGFPIRRGQTAIEIGSAPGGACGRLLELGLNVIGIDPAEMDPTIANHDCFQHIQARAGDLPRKVFRGAKWLLVDSNVAPEKTLTTLKNIVTHRYCTLEGLLVTLKIGNYLASNKISAWQSEIQSWKPSRVRVRQLSRNKVEVCFAISFTRVS